MLLPTTLWILRPGEMKDTCSGETGGSAGFWQDLGSGCGLVSFRTSGVADSPSLRRRGPGAYVQIVIPSCCRSHEYPCGTRTSLNVPVRLKPV